MRKVEEQVFRLLLDARQGAEFVKITNSELFQSDFLVQFTILIFPIIGAIMVLPKGKEMIIMWNFLFEDTIDGGFFFVQCDTLEEAYEIIWEEIACEHPGLVMDCTDVPSWYDCLGDYTDDQAEQMGYDTY